jgi:hypothetical protein
MAPLTPLVDAIDDTMLKAPLLLEAPLDVTNDIEPPLYDAVESPPTSTSRPAGPNVPKPLKTLTLPPTPFCEVPLAT